MCRSEQSNLNIARIVIEAATPLSVSTGTPDNVFDSALVRDANGLPAIPGTSLAGVLRHLWWDLHDKACMEQLFGFQKREQGQPSRLQFTWGYLLDSRGKAAEGLLLGDERKQRMRDPLYEVALKQIDEPLFRDRVRMTQKGAAADTGKFDRAVLPAGNRFVLEMRLWSKSDDTQQEWEQLLGLFSHPGFRLGGATRAGLGRMRLCSIHAGSFDLKQAEGIDAFLQLGRDLCDISGLREANPPTVDHGWLSGELELEANGLWRIGQGDKPIDTKIDKPADLLPRVEERIQWNHGVGERQPAFALFPASSLKGALAHRMAFHVRRLSGQWSHDDNRDERPEALTALLGDVKEKDNRGRAGILYLDDAYLPTDSVQIARLMHNAIDRFTGGVRDRVLYEEESLLGGTVKIAVSLDVRRFADDERAVVRQSLKAALDDLTRGRLGLGSRTTTGNGFFHGGLSGPLADWLQAAQNDKEEAA